MEYLYGLTVALFLTIALIPLLIRMSGRLGLVDDPSAERKVHSTAMPRTGGLGIVIGAALPLLFLVKVDGYLLHLFAGCAIIVVFGLLDDRMELRPIWKIFGQVLAAVVVMSGGIVISQFPFFGLEDAPAWLTYPVTFFFLVGVVNGVNFSDGLDGLAAGTSIMALLLIFVLALQSGNSDIALIALTVIGGVLGFLRYNTFPANIFMGDAGSQFLGFLIACLAIAVTQSEHSPYSALLPVLIVGIPIMDILQVIPVRIYKKLPLPGPDKEHFHHQMGKLGFRHVEVVTIQYLLQATLLVVAFLLCYESDLLVALFYAVFVTVCLGALFTGNLCYWRFREQQRRVVGQERRNGYLRRLDWYFRNSARVLAVLLAFFFILAGWQLAEYHSLLVLAAILTATLLISLGVSFFAPAEYVFRMILYSASVLMAYSITTANVDPVQQIAFYIYAGLMVLALVLGIRMTRKREFSLTTQDLLILLVVVLMPLLPFDMMDQYAIGSIALIVALLMYASEFVLNRATRMVVFPCAGAIAGSALLLLSWI
jgi:UDP-GlcNAc:undecaprenyl-phosphate/decaprenyl-phosphate GlcNAc-1-phosphate transferase